MLMNIYDYAEEKKISIRQVLDFKLLSNPIGPSNKARSAMRSALKATALPPDGKTRHLRRYLAGRERIKPENTLFCHGSTLLLELLLVRVKPGKVLVPGPLPTHYVPLLQRHGTSVVSCPLREEEGFSLDLRRLAPLIDYVDMLLIPNPHWVTGTLIPLPDLHEIAEMLQGSDKMLVLDEGLVEFTGGAYPAEQVVRSENMLVLRTFSHYHALAGLRLGYAVGSARILSRIQGGIDPGPVSTVAAAGAIASLKDKGFHRRTLEFLKMEKVYLIDMLGRIDGVRVMDTACNFLLVRLGHAAADLEKGFHRRHILVERFEDEDTGPLIRLPVRRHRENARFAKTLAGIVSQSKAGHTNGG
jgi:threonine-phosphate decarboxylase